MIDSTSSLLASRGRPGTAVSVILHPQVYSAVKEATALRPSTATVGVLLGTETESEGQELVTVKEAIAVELIPEGLGVNPHKRDMERLNARLKSTRGKKLRIVGIFFADPGIGQFPSRLSISSVRQALAPGAKLLLMVNPTTDEGAFGVWRGRSLAPLAGFYEVLPGDGAQAAVPWTGDWTGLIAGAANPAFYGSTYPTSVLRAADAPLETRPLTTAALGAAGVEAAGVAGVAGVANAANAANGVNGSDTAARAAAPTQPISAIAVRTALEKPFQGVETRTLVVPPARERAWPLFALILALLLLFLGLLAAMALPDGSPLHRTFFGASPSPTPSGPLVIIPPPDPTYTPAPTYTPNPTYTPDLAVVTGETPVPIPAPTDTPLPPPPPPTNTPLPPPPTDTAAPPPPQATNTPVAPTAVPPRIPTATAVRPVAPTATVRRTNTPRPVRTNTPVRPTNTPVRNTPVPPTPTRPPVPPTIPPVVPTNTPVPPPSPQPQPTNTQAPPPLPTQTPAPPPPPPLPTDTPEPPPRSTPRPTNTPVPQPTNTPAPPPTNTPRPTAPPIDTPRPTTPPIDTPRPTPRPYGPEASPGIEITGAPMPSKLAGR